MLTKIDKIYIPTIILLIVFGVLFQSKELKESQTVEKSQKLIPIIEENNQKEIKEPKAVSNRDINISIDIGEDRNITIKTPIELKADINSTSIDNDYKYIWKEDNKTIGEGLTLTKSFELGEHLIDFIALDKQNNTVGEDKLKVTAWKYKKIEKYYFDNEQDEYILYDTVIYNYLNQLVMRLTTYDIEKITYNQNNQKIIEYYENFNSHEWDYTINYSYDNNKILSMEKIDGEGNIIETHIYDENGKDIIEEDKDIYNNENEIEPKKEKTVSKLIKFYNKDGNLTHLESANGMYIKNYKYKDGRIIYQETIYPKGKNTISYQYDKNGRELQREYIRYNENGEKKGQDTINKEYNQDGKMIKKERVYISQDNILQHTIEKWKYEDKKLKVHETKALVGVCPCSADIVEERTTYQYNKDGSQKSLYEYKKENDSEFQKIKDGKEIISYTNTLE